MVVPLQSIPGAPELLIIVLNLVLGVAILLAILGGFYYFVDRTKSGGSMDERFDRVEREVGGVQARVENLDDRVAELEDLRDRVEELERIVGTDGGEE
jgi:Tfp pilus assembly protein PilO